MTTDDILRKLREFICDSLYNVHSSLRTVNVIKISKMNWPTN
jgi:hypothetical protein